MRRALTASATVLALVFGLLGWMPGAYAQGSSAAPVILGYLATSGCPGTLSPPCFIQWSPTNPVATTATATLTGSASNAADGVATSTNNLSDVSYPFLWNGATFDRWKGDATNGAFVNVKVLPALVAGTAIIGKVGIDQTTPGTTNGVQINAAIPAGANLIGKTGIDQTTPGTTNGVQVNAALPAGTNVIGKTTIDQTTPGTTNAVAVQYGSTALVADPCQAVAKTFVPISQATNTKLFSQTSAKKNYICSIMIVGSDAENISLVEGTGSICGTNTAAIIGATTAAAGPNLAANGGFSMGSGVASVAAGTNANFDVCLFQSGAGRVAGVLTYVQQ